MGTTQESRLSRLSLFLDLSSSFLKFYLSVSPLLQNAFDCNSCGSARLQRLCRCIAWGWWVEEQEQRLGRGAEDRMCNVVDLQSTIPHLPRDAGEALHADSYGDCVQALCHPHPGAQRLPDYDLQYCSCHQDKACDSPYFCSIRALATRPSAT